jgi:hypothetical protein
LVAGGLLGSLLLTLNVWPRAMCLVCTALFLSFVAAAQRFSSYQSDGMLLEAGLLAAFLAPPGLRPGLGVDHPPSRAARWLLLWEWFRLYFCSGVVKVLSGDVQWRSLTAMEHYYENLPLPTWLGWYVQQLLPTWFHRATSAMVLLVELVVPFAIFIGRRTRVVVFALLTVFQLAIILTANYGFLNFIVLALGVLLLDDRALRQETPRPTKAVRASPLAAMLLTWLFVATIPQVQLLPQLPEPLLWPALALEPFRVANGYGLFAVMTDPRYELEFQGSDDGQKWTPYPFRFKPQDVSERPGLYSPYQPRFDWNLWFASLGSWQQDAWVVRVEERLLEGEPAVLALFRGDPFHGRPPRRVRCVKWRYWFTTPEQKRATGRWWNRELIGVYAPALERTDGNIRVSR